MADLPVVVLREIFDFFSIWERFRLRCICKGWKFVIETFNSPPSLCVYSNKYPSKEKWSFSDRIVTEHEVLYLNRYSNRRLSLRMEFFRNLQSLYLYNIDDKRLNLFLEELNGLSQLKVLMITKGEVHLKLLSSSSLEMLSLECCVVDAVEVDTPNLNSLAYRNSREANDEINFRFPLKVQHLECLSFTSKLSQLKNLETLLCMEIVSDFSLNDFKYLKRLEIWPLEEHLPLVRRIHEERKGLNRPLELIVSGLKEELVIGVSNEFQATSLRLTSHYLEMIERNSFKFVGPGPWQFETEIGTLVKYWERVLSKFFNGCHFHVEPFRHYTLYYLREKGVPLTRVIELLRRSHSQSLTLEVRQLPPSFYVNRVDLPVEFYHQIASLESLTNLSVEIRFDEFSKINQLKNFDFDCFRKLKNLQILRIHSKSIPLTFLCKAVKQFKFFFQIEFRLLEHSTRFIISIVFAPDPETDDSHPFLLAYGPDFDVDKTFANVDEVVQELNEMRESYFVSFPSLQPLLV